MILPQRLTSILESKHIPHALLFSGSSQSQLSQGAACFIKALFSQDHPTKHEKKLETNNHSDVHVYKPEGTTNTYPIALIRQIIQLVPLKPLEAPWKVFVLHDADRMLAASGNALLKTLEEPPAQTLFILLTTYGERLLPTIRSRCQMVLFPKVETQDEEFSDAIFQILTGGAPLSSLDKFECEKNEEKQQTLLKTILYAFREKLLLHEDKNSTHLNFPKNRALIEKLPLLPLEKVESLLQQTKLGLERSIKLNYCLEILLLRLI